MPRRVLFVWTGLTSYMGDCWRALAAVPDVALKIVIDVSGPAAEETSFRSSEVLRGLDAETVTSADGDLLARIRAWRPEAVFAVGWHSRVVRAIVRDGGLDGVPKVCCFDMPWRWSPRCLLAPLVLGRFLRRYAAAFVPGAAAARYAKWLGFRRIETGLFALDTARFASGGDGAAASSPPQGDRFFLYLGRNVPEKRLGDIRSAHARYRRAGGRFGLRLCGRGLEDGFAAPADVPALLRNAAALVLASSFDPWPLAALEAMAAGTPVIASDSCMNRLELGATWHVFRTGDAAALAQAMADVEGISAEARAAAAEAARAESRRYDVRAWTARVVRILMEEKS